MTSSAYDSSYLNYIPKTLMKKDSKVLFEQEATCVSNRLAGYGAAEQWIDGIDGDARNKGSAMGGSEMHFFLSYDPRYTGSIPPLAFSKDCPAKLEQQKKSLRFMLIANITEALSSPNNKNSCERINRALAVADKYGCREQLTKDIDCVLAKSQGCKGVDLEGAKNLWCKLRNICPKINLGPNPNPLPKPCVEGCSPAPASTPVTTCPAPAPAPVTTCPAPAPVCTTPKPTPAPAPTTTPPSTMPKHLDQLCHWLTLCVDVNKQSSRTLALQQLQWVVSTLKDPRNNKDEMSLVKKFFADTLKNDTLAPRLKQTFNRLTGEQPKVITDAIGAELAATLEKIKPTH